MVVEDKAWATHKRLSLQAHLLMPIDGDIYFALEVDDRQVQTSFLFDLLHEHPPAVMIFSDEEDALGFPWLFLCSRLPFCT